MSGFASALELSRATIWSIIRFASINWIALPCCTWRRFATVAAGCFGIGCFDAERRAVRRTTRSEAANCALSDATRNLNASRQRRLIALRRAAEATKRLGITSPSLHDCAVSAAARDTTCKANAPARTAIGAASTDENWAGFSKRRVRGNVDSRTSAADSAPVSAAVLSTSFSSPASDTSDSDCETMPPLGATRANHVASSAGLHANEKTVGALAAHDGRLVGAFHWDGSLFAKNLKLNTKMGPLVKSEERFSALSHSEPGLWITLR